MKKLLIIVFSCLFVNYSFAGFPGNNSLFDSITTKVKSFIKNPEVQERLIGGTVVTLGFAACLYSNNPDNGDIKHTVITLLSATAVCALTAHSSMPTQINNMPIQINNMNNNFDIEMQDIK